MIPTDNPVQSPTLWSQLKRLPLRRYRSLCDIFATKRLGIPDSDGTESERAGNANSRAMTMTMALALLSPQKMHLPGDTQVLLRSSKSCAELYDDPTIRNQWHQKHRQNKKSKVEYVMLWDPEEHDDEFNNPQAHEHGTRAPTAQQTRCTNCARLYFASLASFDTVPVKSVVRCASLPGHLFPHERNNHSSSPNSVPIADLTPIQCHQHRDAEQVLDQKPQQHHHQLHFCSLDCRSSYEYQREMQDLFHEQFECDATCPTPLDDDDDDDDDNNFSGSELDDLS